MIGYAHSYTDRKPSSKVTATVLREVGAVSACVNVVPR